MKNRLISCFLLLVMVLSLFSCNKQELVEEVKETVNKAEVNTDSMLDSAVSELNKIPSVNLSEHTFTIVSLTDMKLVPVGDNSKYDSAISIRNKLFEKKFHTSITRLDSDIDTALDNAKSSMLAGLYYCDLFAIEESRLGRFITASVLLNLKSLAKSDFSKSYYDTDAIDQATNNTDCYAIFGDYNKDIASYYCLYINRSLLSAAGYDMPYDKVENGSWTLEDAILLAKEVSDINGNVGGLSANNPEMLAKAMLNSSGQSSVDSKYAATPTLAYGNSTTDKILDCLRRLSCTMTANNDFIEGKYLFRVGTVDDMKEITTMKDDWCVLPLPKTDAAQSEYYTPCNSDHTAICVFAGVDDTDKISYAIDGLYAASSGGYMTASYYNELIKTSIRDSSTLDMLDYICGVKGGKPIFDFADIFGVYLPTFTALYWNGGMSASEIASSQKESFSSALNGLY